MISSHLDGGLGNMLFQISAGYAHSLRINSNFFLLEESENFRKNYLDQMRGQISKEYAQKTVISWKKYKNSIFSKIPVHLHENLELVKQGCFKYTPIPHKDNIIIEGFFQSEKFFKDYVNEIKDLFTFDKNLMENNDKKLNSSKKKKLGIHFRRYKVMTDILPPMPWVYYEIALKKFDSQKYDFFIFSDDIDDVAKNFGIKQFNFLENNNELDDLYCLSQCDSIIMSNSTFSWWGAWLGKKKERVVVPPFWFGRGGPRDIEDLIPDRWEVLT